MPNPHVRKASLLKRSTAPAPDTPATAKPPEVPPAAPESPFPRLEGTPVRRALKIAVADDERYMREYYQELLARLGHQVIVAEGGRQLVQLCQDYPPDLVIADIKMADLDGLAAAAEINQRHAVPVVVVSAYHDAALRERAHGDYVMAFLIKPVKQADLESAIELSLMRFDQFQALRREAADLRQALEDRKVIERAKGILMRHTGLDEPEAFHRLQRLASDKNRRLIEIAQLIVNVGDAFEPAP